MFFKTRILNYVDMKQKLHLQQKKLETLKDFRKKNNIKTS